MAKFLVEILVNALGEPQVKAAFDSIGASAGSSATKVDQAQVRVESALRRTQEAAAKLKDQMADTTKSTKFIADMSSVNAKLGEQVAALKGGAAGLLAYTASTREAAAAQQILVAQVRAGVAAESAAGVQIANLIRQQIAYNEQIAILKVEMAGGIGGGAGAGGGFSVSGVLTGIGAAFTQIMALYASISLIKRGISEIISAGSGIEGAMSQISAGVISTGKAAGFSTEQLMAMALQIQHATGKNQELVASAESVLLTFTRIKGGQFYNALNDAIDISVRRHMDLQAAVVITGKIYEGFLGGAKRVGVIFTDEQTKMIKSLFDTGHAMEAQALIHTLLQKSVGDSAIAYRNTLGGAMEAAKSETQSLTRIIAGEMGPAIRGITEDYIRWAQSAQGQAEMAKLGRALAEVVNGLYEGVKVLGPAFKIVWTELKILMELFGLAGRGIGWLSDKVSVSSAFWGKWAEEITGVQLSLNNVDFDRINTATDVSMGHVLALREAYGKLGESAIEAAQKEIKAMEARAADLEQQAAALKKPNNPALFGLDAALGQDSNKERSESARKAAEEAENLRNIIGNLNDRLKEHVKAAAGASDADEHLGKAASDAMHNLMTALQNAYNSNIKEAEAAKLGSVAYEEQRIAAKVLTEQTKYLEEAHKGKTKASQADLDNIALWVRGAELAADRTKAWLGAEKMLADGHSELIKKIEQGFSLKIDTTSLDRAIAQEQKLEPIQAALNDAIYKTSIFTEAANIKRKVEIELGKSKHTLSAQEIEDIQSRIERETAEETLARTRLSIQLAINQAEAVTRGVFADVEDWQAARAAALQYGAGIASILQQYGLLSHAAQQRAIDEKVLAEKEKGATEAQQADYRQKLEQEQETINGLHKLQAEVDISERRYKELADSLATNLSGVFDNFVKTGKTSYEEVFGALRDSFASTLSSIVKEWLTTWFQAMAQWLARWIATQAAAKAGSAVVSGVAGGGNVEGADSSGAVTSMASSAAWAAYAKGGSSTVSGGGGGMGALFSGTGSYGAVGMVGAWVVALAIFGIAMNKLNDHMQSTEQDAIDLNKTLDVSMATSGGGAHISNLIATGKALAYQIKQFFTAYDGIFASLDESIGVKRRGRGNNTEWKVYADGVVTSFGKDMNAALGFALIEAVKHSSSAGLDPLVVAAIKDYAGKSIDEFKAQVDFAQRIATQNLPGISGQLSAASQQYFSDLHQAQAQFADDLSALNDATQSIAQKFSDTVQGIKNSALGIDTSTADFLAGLVGLQDRMSKATDQITSQLQAELDKATTALSGMGSGPKTKPGLTGEESDKIKSDWDTQRAALESQVKKYTDLLAQVPKALSDTEVNMSIFGQLYKYLQGSGKYAQQAAEYAKMKVDIEFEAIKLQLIALDKWAEFANMWTDALAAAEGAAIQDARRRPSGSGNTAADKQSFIDQLRSLAAQGSPVTQSFLALQNQLRDLAEQQKKSKAPADLYAAAVKATTDAWWKAIKEQREAYLGIGTDFTKQIKAIQDFYDQLRKLPRDPKTGGVRNTGQLNQEEKDALTRLGAQLTETINQFMGLTNPMIAINTQADAMRQNIIAYGKAMGWTDDQINKMLADVDAGVEYQRHSAINGIIGNLYNYLKDDEAYQKDKQAFDLQMMELNFQLMEAQLKALGAWDAATEALWTAAHDAAIRSITGIITSVYHYLGYQPGEVHGGDSQELIDALNNAAKAWQDGIAQFTQQTQSLMLNPQLSGLSPQQQMAAAQANFRTLLAQSQAGDTTALGQLDQARQAYLQMARTMFGGGAGFDAVWNEVMSGSANVLANAANEQVLAVQHAANMVIAGAAAEAAATRTAIYDAATQVADAIWAGLSGLPHYANGGIALHPHIAVVGEKGPEAIIPFRHPALNGAGGNLGAGSSTGSMHAHVPVREINPHPDVMAGRVLPMRRGGHKGAGNGHGSSGTGDDADLGIGAGLDKLSASIDHLAKEQRTAWEKTDKRARVLEEHAASTAKSNKSMAKSDAIRVMIAKRA